MRSLVFLSSVFFLLCEGGCGVATDLIPPEESKGALTTDQSSIQLPPLGAPELCQARVYRVRARQNRGPFLKSRLFFPSIGAALADAKKIGACAISVNVAAGTYTEGVLNIDRPTTIRGRIGRRPRIIGAFLIQTRQPVKLQNLHIDPKSASLPGISNLLASPDLTLRGIKIVNARGFGIRLTGGKITATGLVISHTSATTARSTGCALRVGGGTQARLTAVYLHHNVQALFAWGRATHVKATGLRVEDSGYHPAVLDQLNRGDCTLANRHLGAVEFAGGAVGTGTIWTIRRSAIAGIFAHDSGSVTVSKLGVFNTASLFPAASSPCSAQGGFGLVAHQRGQIDVRRFVVRRAGLCLVVVGRVPGTGMDLSHGILRNAPIGACVQQAGFDLSRLANHVLYVDVGVPLRAPSYSPPGTLP